VLPFGTNFESHSEDVELAGIGSRGQPLPDNQQKDIYLRLRKGASTPSSSEVVFAQDVPPAAKSLYVSAVADIESQRPDQGILGLEKALAVYPQYFAALLRLGTLRIAGKEFENAISLFERALEVNKRCFDCHYGIAYSNYHLKKFADAIASAEKGIQENADSDEMYVLLGMAARSVKDHPKAEKALLKAVKVSDGQNANAHWQLALLYGRDQERFADAAKELELYLKASPDAPNKKDVKNLIKQFKDKAKASNS
jgi:tetratricopeptide (TPR) repeat protein